MKSTKDGKRIKLLKRLLSPKQDDVDALPPQKEGALGAGAFSQLRRLITKKKTKEEDEDDSGGKGGSGGSGRIGGRGRKDWSEDGKRKPSFLVEETKSMDRRRREMEQGGHRQLAKVHAREHNLEETSLTPEGELQNSILQHPWLDGQRFDGIDPNVNPEPPLNTDARREFDNERREQEMEKQLRLGNMPKFSTAPKPGQQ